MASIKDKTNPLAEAAEHFSALKFTECVKSLSQCPKDDMKTIHNLAIAKYLDSCANFNESLEALKFSSSAPILDVDKKENERKDGEKDEKDIQNNTIDPHKGFGATSFAPPLTIEYEGNEIAHYNRAVILLQNGYVDSAIALLRELIKERSPPLLSTIRFRSAILLQLATMGKRKIRTPEDDSTISKILQENIKLLNDPTYKKLVDLALAGNSVLHDWFKDSEKSKQDRIVYNTNLGILALNDNKVNLASVYFSRAFADCDEETNKFTACSVYYNCGVCALLRREYDTALKTLLLSKETLDNSPLLWLRITQSALGKLLQITGTAVADNFSANLEALNKALSESKTLPPGYQLMQLPNHFQFYGDKYDDNASSLADITIKALVKAFILLVPRDSNINAAAENLCNTNQHSMYRVLQLLLVYNLFIELHRCNFTVAASIGQNILTIHKKRPMQADIFVSAVCYTVEALIMTGKADVALNLLQKVNPSDMISTTEATEEQKMRIEAVFINLVIVHITNGSWKVASSLTNSLISKFTSNGDYSTTVAKCALILHIFLELAQGNKNRATELLTNQLILPPTF